MTKSSAIKFISKNIFILLSVYFLYRFILIFIIITIGFFDRGPLAEIIFQNDLAVYWQFLFQDLLYLLIAIGLWRKRYWGLGLGLIVTFISLVSMLGAAAYNGFGALSIGDYLWGIVSVCLLAVMIILFINKRKKVTS